LDSNAEAEKEELEEKRKEIEGICDPIIKRVMDGGAGGAEGSADEEEDDFEDEF
jgi:L1 cell adhesion molecule like protein